MLTLMQPAQLLLSARKERMVSIRELAQASGVSSSTIHRIESGKMEPTVEMLQKLLEALGMSMEMTVKSDYAQAIVGLADAVRSNERQNDSSDIIRKTAELVTRFRGAGPPERHRMISAEPESTGDERWDAFLAALAEWVAVSSQAPVPAWVNESSRYLSTAWWVTPMESMRAWEYAGAPASFQNHGVYIHRDSLVNV